MMRQQILMRALFLAFALLAASLAFSAATYPDMVPFAMPSPAPPLPAGMDPAFAPPVNNSVPSVAAPTFAEWTRTGAPDDNLVVTSNCFSTFSGADLGKDSNFLVFGQTTRA